MKKIIISILFYFLMAGNCTLKAITMNFQLTGALILNKAVFGDIKISTGLSRITFNMDSANHLSSGIVATAGIEVSLDDGQTWKFVASGTRPGGIVFDDAGIQMTEFAMTTVLPEPENPNRRIRIFLQVEGGSLFTSGGSVIVE